MAGVIDLPEPTFVPPTPPPWLELVDVWVAKVDKRQCNVVVSAVPDPETADAPSRRLTLPTLHLPRRSSRRRARRFPSTASRT